MQVKPIFIISAGHSGSTILDLLLGTASDIFSTGELAHLPFVFKRPLDTCSCSSKFSECTFWSEVSKVAGFPLDVNILRSKHLSHFNKLDHIKRHIWLRPARAIVEMSLRTGPEKMLARQTSRVMGLMGPSRNLSKLYQAIGEVSGSQFVVDSSKDIIRAGAYASCQPKSSRVLVLIRDLRAVVYANYRRGWPHENIVRHWKLGHKRIIKVLKHWPEAKPVLMTYSDYTNDPKLARKKYCESLGIDCPIDEELNIQTKFNHLIAGNPLRYAGALEIRPNQVWREKLPKELQDKYADLNNQVFNSLRCHLTELSSIDD